MQLPTSILRLTDGRWIRAGAVAIATAMCTAMPLAGCSTSGGSAPEATALSGAQNHSLAANPQVREVLANSCFDCHANESSGSFTAKLAPSYIFGAGKGRGALDFSDWSAMDPKRRRTAAAEVARVVESGAMPPGDYDFLHPSAKLTDEQKQLIVQWATHQEAVPAH